MTDSEYPGALWLPANPTNYRAGRRETPKLVVIHCTDGHADPKGTARMWQEPHHGSSAHFVVGQDGSIVQAISCEDIAWHAHEASLISVGIEHSARSPRSWGPSDRGMAPTDIQYQKSAELVAWLCKRYGLEPTVSTIMGHARADKHTTHSDCPDGCGWDWPRYMAMVWAAM